ncbi:hypothetical protein EON65_06865 [archaeon]|nr:MAG: hypothetical protein EON65_06865 [archaeon]
MPWLIYLMIDEVMDLKWIALISLIVQNSGLAIAMRYTFLMHQATGETYITSTAVLNAEIMKFIISLGFCFAYDCNYSIASMKSLFQLEFVDNRVDFFKLMVPSILYTIQNSLQYFSMSCLSAAVFQVLYQMKIITTAVFSVLLLAKRLSGTQWGSIISLSVGVALVQLSQIVSDNSTKSNSLAGLVSVLLGCLTSGFAGVYFEMVLKSSKASIWLRNVQLSLIGIVMGSISCYFRDSTVLIEKGFFVGYNEFVWLVIVLQAAGGLVSTIREVTLVFVTLLISHSFLFMVNSWLRWWSSMRTTFSRASLHPFPSFFLR